MAVIRGGSPLGELSGKMGGVVFARNKGGAYVRSYVVPVNPNTEAQLNARARFGNQAATWHGLTASQKTNWENYAQQIFSPMINANGASFSGINAFVSLSNVVATSNAKSFDASEFTLSLDSTPVSVSSITPFQKNTDPPFNPNTGTLGASFSGTDGNVNLIVDDFSLNTDMDLTVDFIYTPVFINSESPTPAPGSADFGVNLTNTVGNRVGIAFYMSNSFTQASDFVVNPFKILLGVVPPFQSDSPMSGDTLQFATQSILDTDDFQALPSDGDYVRITAVMVDIFGQRKVIGSLTRRVDAAV